MQEVQAGAEARAQAYGENCTYADGRVDFSPMETDFTITFQISSQNESEEIGRLIRQSMDLLLSRFPTGETPGPQPGQVTFRFITPEGEKFLTVKTTEFQELPSDLSGAELYQRISPTAQ